MNYNPDQGQFASTALRAPQISILERSLPPREEVDQDLKNLVCSSAEQLLGWRWRLILAEEFDLDLTEVACFAEGRVNVPLPVVAAVHRLARARRFGLQAIAAILDPWIKDAPDGDYTDPNPRRSWPRAYFESELAAQDLAWIEGRIYDGPKIEAGEAASLPLVHEYAPPIQYAYDEAPAPAGGLGEASSAPVPASLDDIAHELRRLLGGHVGKD
jgi:hypothetical protein